MTQIKATLGFYLCTPEPNKQLFPRAASHCRMCQYQYSLNNQTADRWQNTWNSPEAFWTITHRRRGSWLHLLFFNLALIFYLFIFSHFLSSASFCLSCMQTHTHNHRLRQQPEDIQAWEIICQPFTPSASNLPRSDRQSLRPHFSLAAVSASVWPWPELNLTQSID